MKSTPYTPREEQGPRLQQLQTIEPMEVLKPGKEPSTPKKSQAGETWRYICPTHDGVGDSEEAKRTVAYFYRYDGHPQIEDGWWGSVLGKTTHEMQSVRTRADIERVIDAELRSLGYNVVAEL